MKTINITLIGIGTAVISFVVICMLFLPSREPTIKLEGVQIGFELSDEMKENSLIINRQRAYDNVKKAEDLISMMTEDGQSREAIAEIETIRDSASRQLKQHTKQLQDLGVELPELMEPIL